MNATSPGPSAPDPATGIRALERFLAKESEYACARQAAESFAGRMPHLTTAEHHQLVRLYTREHLAGSRRLRTALERQRAAHEARDALRHRCVTVAFLIATAPVCFALFAFHALVSR